LTTVFHALNRLTFHYINHVGTDTDRHTGSPCLMLTINTITGDTGDNDRVW